MKQSELSKWLKVIAAVAALCCVALGAYIMPLLGDDVVQQFPEYRNMYWPCLVFFWVTELPVLAALVCAWQIFTQIGRDNSFCMENAARLRTVSRLAILDTVLYVLAAVALAVLKLLHPSLLIADMAVVFVGLAVAVASAALSHLTQKAASLKDENDLTI